MAIDNLETRASKSVLKIEKTVSRIYDILTDLSLKLCHVIEKMSDQYRGSYSNQYHSDL